MTHGLDHGSWEVSWSSVRPLRAWKGGEAHCLRDHGHHHEPWFPARPVKVADHSASLVGIADQVDDSPFGVFHHRLAPAFSIVMLWVIGRHDTTLRNYSSMHRMLSFSTDLIRSFRAQHIGTKG
uniref:Uncharacterized protein n=1 Tax=Solanum tuberosum TaxID=4113 RepID=M1DKC3_SOLTU